jgi:hypothetical protein
MVLEMGWGEGRWGRSGRESGSVAGSREPQDSARGAGEVPPVGGWWIIHRSAETGGMGLAVVAESVTWS